MAALATPFTEMLGVRYPIALAPMGSVAGGKLAAAVSEAGGFGFVGGGYGEAQWLAAELRRVKDATRKPWGVGLITWSADRNIVELALAFRPHALLFSFGDPTPYAQMVRAAGCKLVCQVQDLEGARLAKRAGADLIVAQGTEAGGHGGGRATLPFVPAVVDLVAPTPVLAAGGIADGRGLAAALMLGACGALIGTRFYASEESAAHAAAKARIVQAGGERTVRTRVFDVVRGLAWPAQYTGRALRNEFVERWQGREAALAAQGEAGAARYRRAAQEGDFDTAAVWAGENADLIGAVERAPALVERIAAQAEALLRQGARMTQ
ncbi:MAG TPA: nitronate monooxygenase [Burkholderiales bacterium]